MSDNDNNNNENDNGDIYSKVDMDGNVQAHRGDIHEQEGMQGDLPSLGDAWHEPGTITTERGKETTIEGVVTASGNPSAFPEGSIKSTIHGKNSTLKENNLAKVVANPDQYLCKVGTMEITVEDAIRQSLLVIDGAGELSELNNLNTVNQRENDPTPEEVEAATPLAPFTPEGDAVMNEMVQSIGHAEATVCLQKIVGMVATSNDSNEDSDVALGQAAKALQQHFPGASDVQAEQTVARLIESLRTKVGEHIDRMDGTISEDQLVDFLDTLHPQVFSQLMGRVIMGDSTAYRELITRFHQKVTG